MSSLSLSLRSFVLVFLSVQLLFLSSSLATATTYYFSSTLGSDSNSGTSTSSPYKTFTPLYNIASSLVNGDSVLFCQGDSWYNSFIPSKVSGVTYSSYECHAGVTTKPVISSGIQLPAIWTTSPTDSNLLVANISPTSGNYDSSAMNPAVGIRALWVGATRYWAARYPNTLQANITYGQTGEFFMPTSQYVNGYTMYCSELTQRPDYWVGATIYIRILNYEYQSAVVTGSGPGYVTFDTYISGGGGFFFENGGRSETMRSSFLLHADNPGEWWMNRQAGQLYVYPADEATRAGLLSGSIVVSYSYFTSSAGFVNYGGVSSTVQNLAFQYSYHGIENLGNGVMTITNNLVAHNQAFGIYAAAAGSSSTITYNTVIDTESDCISANIPNGLIAYNSVSQCGVYAGWGGSQTQNGITSWLGTISNNYIDAVGYIGINPNGASTISNNVISNVMLVLNDGGGIYGYSSGDLQISGNVLSGAWGNYASYYSPTIAVCVYLDYGSNNNWVQNNTCSNSAQCIQVNAGSDAYILHNSCQSPGIYFNGFGNSMQVVSNLVATTGTNGNLQNPLVRLTAPDYSQTSLGTVGSVFSNNVYCINTYSAYSYDYLWQLQLSEGTNRYNYFSDWVASEAGYFPNWEADSVGYYMCNEANTIWSYVTSDAATDISSQLYGQFQASKIATENKQKIIAIVVPVVVVSLLILVAAFLSAYLYKRYKASKIVEVSQMDHSKIIGSTPNIELYSTVDVTV